MLLVRDEMRAPQGRFKNANVFKRLWLSRTRPHPVNIPLFHLFTFISPDDDKIKLKLIE